MRFVLQPIVSQSNILLWFQLNNKCTNSKLYKVYKYALSKLIYNRWTIIERKNRSDRIWERYRGAYLQYVKRARFFFFRDFLSIVPFYNRKSRLQRPSSVEKPAKKRLVWSQIFTDVRTVMTLDKGLFETDLWSGAEEFTTFSSRRMGDFFRPGTRTRVHFYGGVKTNGHPPTPPPPIFDQNKRWKFQNAIG